MENQVKKQDDQASELRRLLNDVEMNHETVKTETVPSPEPEIDVLNLPPRKEVHGGGKKRAKLKFSRPFGRLMAVVTILLIITVLYFWKDQIAIFFRHYL